MTLRKKSLLSIGLSIASLIVFLYFLSENVLLESFGDLERKHTIKDMHRLQAGFETSLDYLSEKAFDWSHWDDLYTFVEAAGQDRTSPTVQAFIQSNIEGSVFSSLKINYILVFDVGGRLILGRGWDLDTGREIEVPSELLERHLAPGRPALTHSGPDSSIRGLILLQKKPLLLVSQPILSSTGRGPARGSLVFARFLDIAEVKRLQRLTLLPITLKRLDDPELPADFATALAATTPQGPIFTRLEGEDRIVGYTRLQDIYGQPVLMARVDLPRDIYRQGRFTTHSILLSILGAGLLSAMLALLLLDKTALSRVSRLTREVLQVGTSGDLGARVALPGRDELSRLASSINKMLTLLEAAQRRIQESEAGMRLILGTVQDGLLSVDERHRINPGSSLSASTLIGLEDLAGRDFLEVIGLDQDQAEERAELIEFLEILRQRLLPEDSLADLNPQRELELIRPDGSRAWVRTHYTRIDRGDEPPHVLVALTDITRERQMAEKVAQSAKENRQLRAMAEDPDLFREFLVEMRSLLGQVEASISRLEAAGPLDREALHAIYRAVHTIKGTAGAFGLAELGTIAGALEDVLSTVRTRDFLSTAALEEIRESLSLLNEAFQEAVNSTARITGDDLDAADLVLRVPLRDVKRLEEDLSFLEVGLDLKIGLLDELERLREVPLEKSLARTTRIVPDLIARLGRRAHFRFDHHDVAVDLELAHALNGPLIHLIRNAVDHGIEPPEERAAQGKPIEGLVRLSAWREEEWLRLEVADDGAGMDPERLRRTAVARGILDEAEARALTADDCYGLIFRPGFSTAKTITDVSGRGVGMDAVLTTIRDELGGEVRIDTTAGVGTTFILHVPLRPAAGSARLSRAGARPAGRARAESIAEVVDLLREELPTLRLD